MKIELDLNYREVSLLLEFLDYAECEKCIETEKVLMKVFEQINK